MRVVYTRESMLAPGCRIHIMRVVYPCYLTTHDSNELAAISIMFHSQSDMGSLNVYKIGCMEEYKGAFFYSFKKLDALVVAP